jgi:ADP-L-glycero-D-manno-heptose 6-epimerase
MIVITGAAGFIGSCLLSALNKAGYENLMIVDDFTIGKKAGNIEGKKYVLKMERNHFLAWFAQNAGTISYIFHLGARTDTTEFDTELLTVLNTSYSKRIWELCVQYQIPLLYASSAATYGNGELGYNDDHTIINKLAPLNPYGTSKNEFDKFILQQQYTPPQWHGIKFFNVYGPNEYHKGRMASVVFHAYNQLKVNGTVKLFKSHKETFHDGGQMRDFIYVMDVLDVMLWIMLNKPANGIYNLGTGTARTFLALVKSVTDAMQIPLQIDWIDIPADIRNTYQYFTEANMNKLKNAGYNQHFTTLEDGIADYVKKYLQLQAFF